MESNKRAYNGLFWGLTVGAVATVLGSAYYLYNLFSKDDDLDDQDLKEIEELKGQNSEEIDENLNVETAIQIMAMMNRIAEESMKKTKPDLEERRRAVVSNQEDYERICQEVFEAKEYAYNEAMRKVLGQFGNISMEEIQKLMQSVSPLELERINHKYDKQTFEEKPAPDKLTCKEAFKYYGMKFKEEMREFQRIISLHQGKIDPQQDQYFFFRLLTMKMKVDDLLYLKYKYTEPQIKYMLFEYNLFDDPEVKMVNEQLMRFDQMFSPMGDQ